MAVLINDPMLNPRTTVDDQRIEEMRHELAMNLAESSGAGSNAGEFPISESEAMDVVEWWDDEMVQKKYKEIIEDQAINIIVTKGKS